MNNIKQTPDGSRRQFLRDTSVSLAALALMRYGISHAVSSVSDQGYGPLHLTADETTGLHLISLPRGFRYISWGWAGQRMSDGQLTPGQHDGMGVVDVQGDVITLVRNHEQRFGKGGLAFSTAHAFDTTFAQGGTTTLRFNARTGEWLESWASLSGTIANCSGGVTPWRSWLSCEETRLVNSVNGKRHGWVFEVPAQGISNGQPLTTLGNFRHEACAVDPDSGIIYQTEDETASAFYRWCPANRFQWMQGGVLEALVISDEPAKDMAQGMARGTNWPVEWVSVADPEAIEGRAFNSATGAAVFRRGEGCWFDSGRVYFVSTNGGAIGRGQVFEYHPRTDSLRLIYESNNPQYLDGPDNIAVSPRAAGLLLCEDGLSKPKRLMGLTHQGDTFPFAENHLELSGSILRHADRMLNANGSIVDAWPLLLHRYDRLYNGSAEHDLRHIEWAGTCFYDRWLFVNLQTAGITLAITGPWERGPL